jgi:hypothetical protein
LEVYYDGQDYSEVPGSVADKTGNGHNGTIVGNGVGFDSTYKAFTFAGSDDYFHSTLDWSGDQVHSVSFWVKTTRENVPQTAVLLGTAAASGWQNHFSAFELRVGGNIKWYFGSNDTEYYADWTPNTWIHLAFSYIGGGSTSQFKSVYMNGRKLNVKVEPATSTAVSFNSGDTVIRVGGGYFDSIEADFIGSIANLRIYEKVLNADQVKELYDYQKDYFLGSKSQVTLYKGHLGIGVAEPSGQLELAGDERIQEYPPGPMDGRYSMVPGHGEFQVYASTEFNTTMSVDKIFNKILLLNTDDRWRTSSAMYTATAGGSPARTDRAKLASNTPHGQWVVLKLPYKTCLKQYNWVGLTTQDPKEGQIWGSNDGHSWSHVNSFINGGDAWVAAGSDTSDSAAVTNRRIVTGNTTYYSYYAMIITMVQAQDDAVTIRELKFFGTPGPTTLDKGSLTLGRSLDVPRISRYDVDTETPRPEKLVLDFDTTVNDSPTDISGQGNHGTFFGGASYSAADKAFEFDESDDYIRTRAGVISGTNPTFSISLWVNYSGSGSDTFCMIGDTYGTNTTVWCDVADNNNKIRMNFIDNDVSFTDPNTGLGALITGVWNHVVYVYNGTPNGGRSGYVNGVKQVASVESGTSADGNLVLPSTSVITIGALDHTSGIIHELNGKISNFKVYNVALEASEAKKLYNLGRTGRSMVISDTAVGIGKVPEAQLDVKGTIKGINMTTCPVFFDATASSTTAAGADMNFDSVNASFGGGLVGTKFTAPIRGYYYFSIFFMGQHTSGEKQLWLSFTKNNQESGQTVENSRIYDHGTAAFGSGARHGQNAGSAIIFLNGTGDYVQMRNRGTIGSGIHGRYNRFVGIYLSA